MITLQNISKEALGEITELFIKEFNKAPWNDKWTYDRAYNRLKDLYEHPRFIGIVCIFNKKVVGVVMGYLEYWYEGYHYNLKEIFIDTEIQGQGIGSQLLNSLEDKLLDQDVTRIELFTLEDQKTIGFYTKNQFTRIEELVLMEKKLK
ncbi:MAG: GNAT family N-acetyltransferase [Cellulosilyticaceae bacterium]